TPAGALRAAPDRRQHHHPMRAKRDPPFLPAPRQRSRSARTRGTTTKERRLEERVEVRAGGRGTHRSAPTPNGEAPRLRRRALNPLRAVEKLRFPRSGGPPTPSF